MTKRHLQPKKQLSTDPKVPWFFLLDITKASEKYGDLSSRLLQKSNYQPALIFR